MKVIPLHPGLGSASQRARDAQGEPHDAVPVDAAPEGAVPSTPRDTAVDASPLKNKDPADSTGGVRVRVRRRRPKKRASPAQLLARSLDGVRKQQRDMLEIFERSLPAPAPAPEAGRTDAEAAFWPVWLEHRGYLRNHSLRFSGGNLADAEDALSDAMLKAVRNFSPDKIRNHRSWLLRLVHNACMDRHRRNRRRQRVAKDIMDGGARSAPAVVVQPDRSPEELLAAFEQVDDLRRALSALPEFLAEPLLLYLDERSDGEIAVSLNVSREVVRKRRQIARALLRQHISS